MSAPQKPAPEETSLLRLTTAGSVDDGKSTLIGRLLVDTKNIFEDQIAHVKEATARKGGQGLDLALITDGLKAEREQGITIDVAYRYFSTSKRKFILADTPGHQQYTRNMVTGASTADVAILIIDARKGVQTQTRRHAYIANLLGIKHFLVAINKMDLVDYDELIFDTIKKDFLNFSKDFYSQDIHFVPLSALNGDNVVHKSDNMPWYQGLSILSLMETMVVKDTTNHQQFRFPVQYVSRPQQKERPDFRGYMGTVLSGNVSVGDEVIILPSGLSAHISEIVSYDGNVERATAGDATTLCLKEDIDLSRGDMLIKKDHPPLQTRKFSAMLCWMSEDKLDTGKKYLLKHTTKTVKARIKNITYKIDINSLAQLPATEMALNDIARVELALQQDIFIDAYQNNRKTGCFIIIDPHTNHTVGAGMVCQSD